MKLKQFFRWLFRIKPPELADMPTILAGLPDGFLRSRLEKLDLDAQLRGESLTIDDVEEIRKLCAQMSPDDVDIWPYPEGWQKRMRQAYRDREMDEFDSA